MRRLYRLFLVAIAEHCGWMPLSETRTVTINDESDQPSSDFDVFRQRIFEAADAQLAWCSAPIVHFDRGKAVEIRTGVFLQIADMRFMVTAGHRMIEHGAEGRLPHIVMPEKGLESVCLREENFWTTKSKHEDLTVVQLKEATVGALGQHFRFARLNEFMSLRDQQHGNGLYLLYGFPNAMIRVDEEGQKRTDSWKYLTCLFPGDLDNVSDFDNELHLILEYERRTANAEGETVHPHGLSGCGVWFCGNPVTNAISNPFDFRLAGVQTAWHRQHQYVKCTWIDIVAVIIWKHFPDARAAMRLHGMEF